MKRYFSFFVPFFLILGSHASGLDANFALGQRAYDSGLYVEAIEAFEQGLEECDEAERSGLSMCLARAYYQCERDQEAITALQRIERVDWDDEVRLLAALSYKRLGEFAKTRDLLGKCPQLIARWHLGHTAYLQGDTPGAEAVWRTIQETSPDTDAGLLAALYLAQLELSAGRSHKAKEQLKTLEPRLTVPLAYECAFYLGMAEEDLQNWSLALDAYQRALPRRNISRAAWVPQTLKRLANCHLELAQRTHGKQRTSRCQKAETVLSQLQKEFPGEEAQLAMASFLIRKAHLLNSENALNEANILLSDSSYGLTDRNQMLLLRAQAAPSYDTRRFFFRELLQRQDEDSLDYTQCLLLSAQNEVQEGKWDAAIQKLVSAPLQTPEVLLEIGRISLQMSSKEAQEQGLAAIRQAKDYATDPDLPHLLEGALLAQSGDSDPTIAWRTAVESYPNGRYADECLRQIGAWHYQKSQYKEANQSFLDLIARYPASPHCGEALYWMARAQENSGASRNTVQQALREVYQNYSQSPFAPEAYLTAYSYADYLNDPLARTHLSNMKDRFPDSYLTINAQHLLGLALRRLPASTDKRKSPTSRWHQAIEAFQEAEVIFDRLYASGLIPEKEQTRCTTLRCRAKLERALANLAIASDAMGAKKRIYLGYTSDLFRELLAELDQAPWKSEALAPIREETAYGLAVALIRSGDTDTAHPLLDDLLKQYQAEGVSRGYFLSRTLYQKGSLHLRKQQHEQGFSFLQQAEEAAKGNLLSPEEKLDLWLAQSHSLRQLNRLDEAMLILSKAINEDAVSGLRVKAMYLRAEVYQQQGRHELAQKQLEATSRKGGEWAFKAKEKLEQDYGYE